MDDKEQKHFPYLLGHSRGRTWRYLTVSLALVQHGPVKKWVMPRLKPINSHQRQHPLKDRPQADQYHEQFEKISQTTVINEFFDGPKTNCADHANNQNPD
jgi:hypothetical protein